MLLYKNLYHNQLYQTIFLRLCLDGIAGLKFLSQGKWRDCLAIIQAHFAFYAHLPQLIKRRNETHIYKIRKAALIYNASILWQHFIKGRKTYSEIDKIWRSNP